MKKKYLITSLISLAAAGVSMLFDEISEEEHMKDVAEEAARKVLSEKEKSEKKQGNRAQRRAAR